MQYLTGTGQFGDWRDQHVGFEDIMGKDPLAVWRAFESSNDTQELASFAITLLTIVVNQAGCECFFSDLKVKQTQRWNHLGLKKLEKMTKVKLLLHLSYNPHHYQVGADIAADH
ncbi:hypothetical protein F5148DRAFT_1285717 [Russula earlei]|uniref:Uncharacterized protein n=1 Tax=Russula earlei TaxID=71964 RepID=A0ACC0U6A4_9AGAM|nr:hypothetical protein F5148DRAFT_1285717 [Russula earlei]